MSHKKLKILFLSLEGDSFSLAYALQKSDEVRIWTNSRSLHLPMLGLLDKTNDLKGSLKWADLVIGDMAGVGFLEKRVRKSKTPFLSVSLVMDAMELDRGKQMKTMKKFGVQLPPTFDFDSPAAAMTITNHWSEPGYVIKPSGNLNTAKTMLARDKETYIWALEQFASDQTLIVQKVVEGVEISTEGWWNGSQWVSFNHTFEEKRFLHGSLGQNVGCMGNIVIQGDPDSLLAKELKKLTPFLEKSNYRGPIDINTIINENGPHALELTPRFGYDAIEALWAMSDRDQFSAFLLSVATGKKADLKYDYAVGAAVRLTLPPYPMADTDHEEAGLPIEFIEREEVLWSDAFVEDGQMKWAAFDGVLAKVVGAGDDVVDAITDAYLTIDSIQALNLQYRTDIGDRVEGDIATLSAVGVSI